MGKPKKGKKARKDDDFSDDDVEIDPVEGAQTTQESTAAEPKAPAGKKGKKGRRKKDDDWDDDDVAAEIEALSLHNEADNDQEVNGAVGKKGKKKDKKQTDEGTEEQISSKPGKAGMSAFMMLDVDDESDEDTSEEEEEKPEKVESQKKKVQPEAVAPDVEHDETEKEKPQQSKKNKKKGKQKKAVEEDFDAILAEFGAPQQEQPKPAGKKKGKKEKAAAVEEIPDDEAEDTGIDLQKDVSSMTAEELEKYMGLDDEEDDKKKKKKNKKQKAKIDEETEENDMEDKQIEDNEEGDSDDGGTVKTAAQKKKEKRDRQKQKKLDEAAKKKKAPKESTPESREETPPTTEDQPEKSASVEEKGAVVEEDNDAAADGEAEDDSKKKKKDRKKKKGKEAEEEKKKKPSKMALALQEMLKKQKEEEERLQREEDEKERKREELIRLKEEKARLEKEKKDKEKQKKKDKIERLKAEGKYMTAKQREAMKIAQAKLEAMKAAGVEVPSLDKVQEGEKKKKVVYDSRPKKKRQLQQQLSQTDQSETKEVTPEPSEPSTPTSEVEAKTEELEEQKGEEKVEDETGEEEPAEEVKDAWDVSSGEEDDSDEKQTDEKKPGDNKPAAAKTQKSVEEEEENGEDEEEEEDSDEDDDSEEDDEDESESESEEEDTHTAKAKARERAQARISKRKHDADKNKITDKLRAPVVCVLGHVDTGKTKILDKLRRTNVQDGEAGGITQQIGATNVPEETIKEQTKMCKDFQKKELKIPGLLIIDTPGHESFSNLRTRGSSLCDIAILVVDIMHGLEPQTIESINLLKSRKTPFVIALNKVDRLFQWQPNPHSDVLNTIKKQKQNTKLEFDERAQQVTVQFAEQGLNVALFYENKNPREYFSMVPTSAHSGDGMGNLIAHISEMSQTMLAKRLTYSEELQATVMEVKALPGMGTTIDVILVNGSIKEGATIIVAGQEGPIVTQIRGLLLPQPLKELRVKGAYENRKEVVAAQGCKIMAKDLDKALAGLPLYVAQHEDEIEIYKEEISESLEEILGSIKLSERGVFVQASTLGSMEALLEFLKTSKIPYAGINIGPVHKRDIVKASVMLEHDTQYAVILAFDVKVEREAQEMADSLGVTIFTADIIYHLFDKFMAHRDDLKKRKQEEFKHIAVFPCKLRVLPQYIFNSRDPIVCGVMVDAGFVKIGTPVCVPSKEFLYLGRITSLEVNHKSVEKASKGTEVCVKIENTPGETPKLYGRHFDHTDIITSRISRQSIDAVKDYFRDDMSKTDWQLMVELKKLFEII